MNGLKLSGVIITFNEEEKIERCIRSLFQVCHEVIVLDSHSSDSTKMIALNAGAKVFEHDFDGHIQQKNRAASYALCPYIVSLDADEALSDELIESIKKLNSDTVCDAYTINRLNRYGAQWIRHGAWYPDKKLRLWKNSIGQWGGLNPHDKFMVDDTCSKAHLKGNILHYTVNGLDELKTQTEKFSSIAAYAMLEKKRTFSRPIILLKAFYRFVKEYFFLLGFLDGKAGLDIARMNAVYVWLKYTKLLSITKK